MNMKAIRRQMERENRKRPAVLTQIPRDQWPHDEVGSIIEVWISRTFLVQVHGETSGVLRCSINRTTLDGSGAWEQNITWDELMEIKRQIGRGESYAVEVLPEDRNIVNVANLRHIWILPRPVCGWRRTA